MTTPLFTLRQDEEFVYIDIRVPHIRVAASDFFIEGSLFSFYCKPYYLKLTLPGEVLDNEKTRAVYDINENNGTIHVHLPKKQSGENFKDLHMLTKLLTQAPNPIDIKSLGGKSSARPNIEIISSTPAEEGQAEAAGHVPEPEIAEDKKVSAPTAEALFGKISYGFNDRYSGFFAGLREDLSDLVQVSSPDSTTAKDRTGARVEQEEGDFDLERYAGDYAYGKEDMVYQSAMACRPFWRIDDGESDASAKRKPKGDPGTDIEASMAKMAIGARGNDKKNDESTSFFTEDEREALIRLPRREYLIDETGTEGFALLSGLASVCFGYAYDYRITDGDSTVESDWTISILSPLMSWLDSECCEELAQVTTACMRRSLIYPYLRSWDLSSVVLSDTVALFKKGKGVLMKVLLKIRKIFERSETKYLFNKLFIDDYCVWLQSVKEETIRAFALKFEECSKHMNKDKLDLELVDIERQVNMQLQGAVE